MTAAPRKWLSPALKQCASERVEHRERCEEREGRICAPERDERVRGVDRDGGDQRAREGVDRPSVSRLCDHATPVGGAGPEERGADRCCGHGQPVGDRGCRTPSSRRCAARCLVGNGRTATHARNAIVAKRSMRSARSSCAGSSVLYGLSGLSVCPACRWRCRHAPGNSGRGIAMSCCAARASSAPPDGGQCDSYRPPARDSISTSPVRGRLRTVLRTGGANRSGSPLRTLRGDKASGRQPQRSPRPHIMVNLPGALHKCSHSPADRHSGRQRLRAGFATRPTSNALTERRGLTAERARVAAARPRLVR